LFAILSVLPIVVLGLVLSATMRQVVQNRYLSTYAQTSDLTINSLASIVVATPGLADSFENASPNSANSAAGVLQSMIAADRETASLAGLVAFDPQGDVVFSSNASLEGKRSAAPPSVTKAFKSGLTVADFVSAAPRSLHLNGEVVELAVPIRIGKTIPVVVHAYSSAAGLNSSISAGVLRVNWVLGAGLAVLWLILFPVVISASRRLRRQSSENAHLALHDSLTGLANRNLFADRLSHAIAEARRRDEKVGLLLLDLDRFKEVNDSLGHQEGDRLLCQIAEALVGAVRDHDTIARLGGDEFAVILTGVKDIDDALVAARRVSSVLEVPLDFNGVAVTPQASMGIAFYPDNGHDGDTLLVKADIAMYSAKANRQDLCLYDPDKDMSASARLGLVTELRRALVHDEIICHYQPLARMIDKGVWGVEALVRWEHPTRGTLSPAEFLPVVEQAGLIDSLTRRVLAVALAQCRSWRDDGLDLVVAVNLSARSLRDPALPDLIFDALSVAGVPPDRLELEITEEALLEDPTQAKIMLETLAAGGIHIALDDFGTGYSSLAYLSHLPVSKVKIDRAFLQDMGRDEMSEKIVATVIDLGRRLGMDVLAEGVETSEVWDRLVGLGCPQAQGYYLARPMPPDAMRDWASDHQCGAPIELEPART